MILSKKKTQIKKKVKKSQQSQNPKKFPQLIDFQQHKQYPDQKNAKKLWVTQSNPKKKKNYPNNDLKQNKQIPR